MCRCNICLLLIIYFSFSLSPILLAEQIDLKNWIDVAIRNNQPLKISLKKIELAESYLRQARRSLFPEVIFSYEDKEGRIGGLEYDGVSYRGKLEKTVFDGGRSVYNLSRAEINLHKAQKEYQRLKREIVFNVSQAYWKLAQAIYSIESFKDAFRDIERLIKRNFASSRDFFANLKCGHRHCGGLKAVKLFLRCSTTERKKVKKYCSSSTYNQC